MSNYAKDELLKKYQNLPKDIQTAISDINTADIIRDIGEKYKLMIDKIGALADETGLVMLGITHPNQFIQNLTQRLEINKETAKTIAEEVSSKVFFRIRENLKKIHSIGTRDEKLEAGDKWQETGKPPTPPAPLMPPPPPISTPPQNLPIEPRSPSAASDDAFKAKTEQPIFRSPAQIVEKQNSSTTEKTITKIDPYKEALP